MDGTKTKQQKYSGEEGVGVALGSTGILVLLGNRGWQNRRFTPTPSVDLPPHLNFLQLRAIIFAISKGFVIVPLYYLLAKKNVFYQYQNNVHTN